MTTRPADRLGWIAAPRASRAGWAALQEFAARVRADGLDRTLVCGMGGSSLAPRVLAAVADAARLDVLDSTDPVAVRDAVPAGQLAHTLFVVTSKSGTTVETLSFYRYFAARARPDQFVAITDPGTPLEALARERGFRAVFPHPADVGGRYAALTVVGMLPAALLGIDGATLLDRALALDPDTARAFGTRLAEAALAGRDKLVLRPPARVARLADWIEQLVAESSGKQGRGVVPVVGAPERSARADAETVAEFSSDPIDLGLEFLRWEYATWALCERLGVDAFDQPDVEEAKALARAELARPHGPSAAPATLDLAALRDAARPRDYLAILAYLPSTPAIAAAPRGPRALGGRARHHHDRGLRPALPAFHGAAPQGGARHRAVPGGDGGSGGRFRHPRHGHDVRGAGAGAGARRRPGPARSRAAGGARTPPARHRRGPARHVAVTRGA
jgi:hypothetical protein